MEQKPKIEYSEEGILFCDGIPCDMYYECSLRCDICPMNDDEGLWPDD